MRLNRKMDTSAAIVAGRSQCPGRCEAAPPTPGLDLRPAKRLTGIITMPVCMCGLNLIEDRPGLTNRRGPERPSGHYHHQPHPLGCCTVTLAVADPLAAPDTPAKVTG